eukprot:9174667-Pyramimonas_sp.AAC.1
MAVEAMASQLGLPCHVRHPSEKWRGPGLQAEARAWRRAESQALLSDLRAQVVLNSLAYQPPRCCASPKIHTPCECASALISCLHERRD